MTAKDAAWADWQAATGGSRDEFEAWWAACCREEVQRWGEKHQGGYGA